MQASCFKGNCSSIISIIWCRFWYNFCACLMQFCRKRTSFLEVVCSVFASFFFSILSIRACERSEAERVRCVVEAAPQARPEDHLGGIFCSSFVAEYHLKFPSALQHCQHNGAFRFLPAQVFIDFGVILEPVHRSFLNSGRSKLYFCRA